jgi:hypothetical protein
LKVSAAGLEKLDNNALFESQLEAMFVETLRRQKDSDGVPLIVRREVSQELGSFGLVIQRAGRIIMIQDGVVGHDR